jgi:hypothetical protein
MIEEVRVNRGPSKAQAATSDVNPLFSIFSAILRDRNEQSQRNDEETPKFIGILEATLRVSWRRGRVRT